MRIVCALTFVESARGPKEQRYDVNSGPRFVMHADNEARNNWRDPVERLGGPAVNAWRILNARVRCPAMMIHRRPYTAGADLTKERELVAA